MESFKFHPGPTAAKAVYVRLHHRGQAHCCLVLAEVLSSPPSPMAAKKASRYPIHYPPHKLTSPPTNMVTILEAIFRWVEVGSFHTAPARAPWNPQLLMGALWETTHLDITGRHRALIFGRRAHRRV